MGINKIFYFIIIMNSQEGINSTHLFKYKDKKYGFNLFIFASCSEIIEQNIKDYIKQKEINLLIDQNDSNVKLSDNSIKDFILYCHRQGNNINNENVIPLNYLANEYKINQLFEVTKEYIYKHQSELALQYYNFYKDLKIDDNEKKEDLLSSYLFYYINNEQLLEIPIPVLYNIITKFFNNNKNMNEQEKKDY